MTSSTPMQNTDAALAQSVTLTRQARSDLTQQLSTLEGQLASIGQSWVGQGAVAFVRVKSAWDTQVRRLLDALEGFSQDLESVDRTFTATDADVTSGLHQLAARLG